MSSFNKIEKITYTNLQDDIVSLKEYIVFENETTSEKFVLLKLYNTVNQKLNELKFEVFQYNENKNLIEKTILKQNDLNAPKNNWFVPKFKMKVNENCKTIEIKILFAKFESVQWKDNVFENIPIPLSRTRVERGNRENFKNDENPIKERKKSKKERKYIKKFGFYVENIKKRNRLIFSKFFIGLLTVCALALSVLSMLDYKKNATIISDNKLLYSLDYTVVGESLVLTKYEGQANEVVIPEKFAGKPILKIDKAAFKDANIKTISILSKNVVIESNAFENCLNLESVFADNVIENVSSFAFVNCPKLRLVNMEYAKNISENAFSGCENITIINVLNAKLNNLSLNGITNIENLYFGSCNSIRFYNIFGTNEKDIPVSLKTIKSNMSFVSQIFFKGIRGIQSLIFLNPLVVIEEGALAYFELEPLIDTNMKVEDGIILEFKEDITNLCLPSSVKDDRDENESSFYNFLEKYGKNITILTLKYSNINYDEDFFKAFPNLKSLVVSSDIAINCNYLRNNTKLEEISIPYVSNLGDCLYDRTNIKKLVLSDVKRIPDNYFQGFYNLKDLKIIGTSVDYSNNSFNGCIKLEKLVLPNGFLKLNELNNLKEVELLDSTNHVLNSKAFTNLPRLEKISFGNTIKVFNSKIIENCTNLKVLSIPESVTDYTYPIIGTGCNNLKNISIPFLSTKYITNFQSVNMSYESTENIVIKNMDMLPNNFFEACSNLKTIVIRDIEDKNTDLKNLLKDCINVEVVELDHPINSISELFVEKVSKTLKAIKINLNGKAVSSSFFNDCKTIETVELFNPSEIYFNAFKDLISLKNLYISNDVNFENYVQKLERMRLKNYLNFVLGTAKTYSFFNKNINFVSDVEYKKEQKFVYNNLEFNYQGDLVLQREELNYFMYDLPIDFTENFIYSFEAYLDSNFETKCELPYCNYNNSVIYLKRVLNSY